MARDRDRSPGGRAAPDIVSRSASNALAAMLDEMPLELAKRCHVASTLWGMELHVVFEPDEQGWVRATIEELPGVVTCAPTLEEARALVRDALDEWLQALTSAECTTIGADATRETLTLTVA